MKKWTKLLSVFALAGALSLGTFLATGCNKKSDGGDDNDNFQQGGLDVYVTNVNLSANTRSIKVGDTLTVSAEVLPADATDKILAWNSSDVSIATVSAGGVVTALKAGTVTISATASNQIAGTIDITVTDDSGNTGDEKVAVTGVSLNVSTHEMEVEDTYDLNESVTPANATNQHVTWASDNTEVATVSEDGTVTAVKAGTAKITVTTVDGGFHAECTITVKERTSAKVDATGVELSKTTETVKEGATVKLTATVLPKNEQGVSTATNKNVTWSSDNTEVATVSGGTVTGVKAGTATITVTTVDGGFHAECTVTVTTDKVAVTGVTLDKTTLELTLGGANASAQLKHTLQPANATNKSVTWASSDEAVATVSASGLVEGKKAGTAKISVTTADGSFKAECTVTVKDAVQTEPSVTVTSVNVSAAGNKTSIEKEGTVQLSAEVAVTPDAAANKNVTWSSADETIATVSANGLVTGVKAGTVKIYATSTVNSAVKGEISITVTEPAGPVTPGPVGPGETTEKLSEAEFKAAIEASLAAGNFTYTADGASAKYDGASKACTLPGGSYLVYDDAAKKITAYSPVGEIAWEKEALNASVQTLEEAKGIMTGGIPAALAVFKDAYASATYDEASGKYSVGEAYITFADGKVSSFGTTETGDVELSAYGSSEIALPDFTNAFENIVSVNIAKNAVGSKLAAKTEDSSYGLYAEKNDASDYTTASATGYTQTIGSAMNGGIYINLTNLSGKIEGYFEVSASAMGTKWDIIQIRSGSNKIFSVHTSDNNKSNFRFQIREGDLKGSDNQADPATLKEVSGLTVTPAEKTTYKVKYSLVKDATGGNYKLTMTLNGQAFATDYDLGVSSVDSIYVVSSNASKAARLITLDNVIICGTPTEGSAVSVKGIELNKYETRIETLGGTEKLVATVSPAEASSAKLVWSSSDTSIATVAQDGTVTAVKKGTAVITVMAPNGKSVQCTVNVGEAPKPLITVTFVSDGETVDTATAEQGGKVLKPVGVTKTGYTLTGWAIGSVKGDVFDFNTPITEPLTLHAVWEEKQGGTTDPDPGPTDPDDPPGEYDPPVVNPPIENGKITYFYAADESAALEWDENNIANAKVEYKLKTASDSAFVEVDRPLIRQVDGDTARVDILGLKGDATYEFRITTSAGDKLTESAKVSALDRSGYAHFNYSEGVGAYNDDGTLKDNALVIYVTNENKDTVMDEICAANSDVSMFKIPYSGQGKNWGDKNASGIGWWLNNNQYTSNNANSDKNKRPSNTYDAANGGKLGFKSVDRPIVVRFIGTVETPEGCSALDEDEGGINGDNGHMARMKNLKNVTLEGVGEDALIKGWGFHFIAGTDAVNGQGTSFEVRNLTFSEYPEDAVGMEGQQGGGKITAGVERCWIHHNTFLPGYCANPKENDKKEGDGSCDFKRGQYFTCSYNYFEYCHKTNLVGSSDSSLQYNMTYHHNMWYQCGSRIPLTRQANVHFYNNYVCYDATEKTTPYSWIAKPAGSYVHSLRANCYLFSEANYYEGSKQVTDGKTGGAAKGWKNMYYANFGTNTIVEATTREQKVSNNCAYNGTDYSSFDTDPKLFYYDADKKQSDCYITDAATARQEVLAKVGVQGFTPRVKANMLSDGDKPASALSVGKDGLTIDLTKASIGGTVDGVKFINAKNNSGAAKGKGILATFTIAENTEITISSGTVEDQAIELLREDGYVVAGKISTYTGTLKAGTYFIASGQKDKDGSISALSFKSGVTEDEKVQNVIDFINAIGEVVYTEECKNKIAMAQTAYNALSAALKSKVTNYATLQAASEKYNKLAVAPVEELIAAIGTVTADSGEAITAARTAYSALTAAQQALVSNYAVLTAAEKAYESFEVEGLNKQIAALADPSSATTEEAIEALLEKYNSVATQYADLDEDQKTEIVGYSKVTSGITALEAAIKPYEVKALIEALPAKADVTLSHSAAVTAARTGYDALTSAGKEIVGDITKLTEAEEVINKLASESKVAIFQKGKTELATDAGFTVNGSGYRGTSDTFTYNGVEYNSPLKIQQSTTITFSTSAKMKVTIYLHSGGSQIISVDGTKHTANNGVVEIELAAGSHTISKGEKEAWLCYVVLSPAA